LAKQEDKRQNNRGMDEKITSPDEYDNGKKDRNWDPNKTENQNLKK